ncbi:hypothetical protein PsorP6_015754 [Peronosclerospora sorghi]|uniref:Uncharacterized protein n=1 Tax=Peronosclerospora sorghi TaxID=230839 RepID=A0ACC0WQS4_9STRA|nr:hypothetical protein PsorP6_015754 [Peronosclerospora sorghi]
MRSSVMSVCQAVNWMIKPCSVRSPVRDTWLRDNRLVDDRIALGLLEFDHVRVEGAFCITGDA